MKPALLILLAVVLASPLLLAADKWPKPMCTIVSTENVSRTMRDAGPGANGAACPTATDLRSSREACLAVRCDTAACIATGSGTSLTAACAYDGGADTRGVLIQANSIYDVCLSSGDDNIATISPNGSGTSSCTVSSVAR